MYLKRDYSDIVNKLPNRIDRKNILFYVDPPYVGTKSSGYRALTPKQFKKLIKTLVNSSSKFAISERDSKIVNNIVK